MPVHGEWLDIPGAAVGPHFKYLPKRRFMDTSNWIRLKKGYDSLDASKNPPLVCWEKISPDNVTPLLTKSTKQSLKTRVPSSARAQSARPALRREKAIDRLPSEIKADRPITSLTVNEIKKMIYVPNLQKLPKPASIKRLSHLVFGNLKDETDSGKDGDKRKTPPKNIKHNPYKELFVFRNVQDDPTMLWLKTLWKIAREFCISFESLGTGNPKVTDSFMVNLLTSGCFIKEMAPINLQQMEDIGADLEPLIFQRPIDYGILPTDETKPYLRLVSKRQRAFAYGRWYYPVKFWGKLDHEETEMVKEKQRIIDEESLLTHPCYKNYYLFLKDKGYRIPQVLYDPPEKKNKEIIL